MRAAIPATASLLAVFLVCCGFAEQRPAGEPSGPPADDSAIRVEHNPETFVTNIRIRAKDGGIAWADVLRGLARARGNDDSALEGMLPEGRFELTSAWWRLTRAALNLAMQPHVRFEVEQAAAGGEPRLVVTLDRAALLASERHLKAMLRTAWLKRRSDRRHFGLEFDDRWQQTPPTTNLVVVVHGLDSSPERCKELIAAVRTAGLPCAAFRYPGNQPIAESAKLLGSELKKLAKEHPNRGVSLVTSSMGGLVARAAVEDADLDPGNVRQLVMIAPPNHGSALARFEFGLDLWSNLVLDNRRKEVGLFYAVIEDGMCEAAGDLTPGSPLLKKLNARPRNPKVRYAVFLGTAGPLQPEELVQLRQSVAKAGQQNRWVRFFGARVQTWLEDLDEVVEGKGDGAVSLARGRLEGVADTLVLKFSHVDGGPDAERMQQEVLTRLKKPAG